METFLKQTPSRYFFRRYFLLLFCLGSLFSCCDSEGKNKKIPFPTNNESHFVPTDLEVVWIVPIHYDTSDEYPAIPLLMDDYIIVTNSEQWDRQVPPGFVVLNKHTGERHPAWKSDMGKQINKVGVLDYELLTGDNNEILIVKNAKWFCAFDIPKGQMIWSKDVRTELTMSSYFSDVYVVEKPSDNIQKIVKYNAYTGDSTRLTSHQASDTYNIINMNAPSVYIHNGDSLMYYVTGDWSTSKMDGRVWAFCYNITKKRMEWENKNFTDDRDASGTLAPPLLYDNDKLLIHTLRGVACLNAVTGESIWTKTFYEAFFEDGFGYSAQVFTFSNPLLHQDRIYLRDHSGNVYCVDAQTGGVIWKNDKLCVTPSGIHGSLVIYKNRLYVSGAGSDINSNFFYGLHCLDLTTGEEIWRDTGPSGKIWSPLAIDEKMGYLYCCSSRYIMCIDLNKTEEKMLQKKVNE